MRERKSAALTIYPVEASYCNSTQPGGRATAWIHYLVGGKSSLNAALTEENVNTVKSGLRVMPPKGAVTKSSMNITSRCAESGGSTLLLNACSECKGVYICHNVFYRHPL